MSRYANYSDDYDGPDTSGLWYSALHRAITSPRGQRLLREIEAALLALPEPRLIEGAISNGAGVCVVGAIAAYRRVRAGDTWATAFEALHEETDGELTDGAIGDTADWARDRLKMARTIAWELAEHNDDFYSGMTPEERHAATLLWVRKQIIPIADEVLPR